MTSSIADERAQRAEQAKAARREEILDAARRVFAERGFRGTTIADIAEAAKIALGTIYLYFSSKEDVFAALHQRFNEVIMRSTRDVLPGEQPAHEDRWRDGLNLPAQPADGEAMDPHEQASLAPLEIAHMRDELTTQHDAL